MHLLLLLLKHLLLSRRQMLKMRVGVRARGHATHHRGIDLPSWARDSNMTGELVWHRTTGHPLLTTILRHAGSHGMSGHARVVHRGMPIETGPHTSRHHRSGHRRLPTGWMSTTN